MSSERFLTTLTRNALAAAALGVPLLVALPRRDGLAWDYLDAFAVAFCFTLPGHYVEVLLLKIPGVAVGWGRVVRLAGWFAGGLWCYLIARWLWVQLGRDLTELPGLVWGGPFFIALQLVIHAVARGPSSH